MPEITAQTIITNKLKKIYDLPVIFFSFNEQSAQEGFRTRLEAFVDLMHARRDKKIQDQKESLKKDVVIKDLYEHYGNSFYNECVQLIQTK